MTEWKVDNITLSIIEQDLLLHQDSDLIVVDCRDLDAFQTTLTQVVAHINTKEKVDEE